MREFMDEPEIDPFFDEEVDTGSRGPDPGLGFLGTAIVVASSMG